MIFSSECVMAGGAEQWGLSMAAYRRVKDAICSAESNSISGGEPIFPSGALGKRNSGSYFLAKRAGLGFRRFLATLWTWFLDLALPGILWAALAWVGKTLPEVLPGEPNREA